MFSPGSATIRRVRLRSRADPLAFRRQVEGALDRSSLHPASLPPTAILCVRKVPMKIGSRPNVCEGAELSERMERFAREAVRPWQNGYSTDASAVLFLDRAELLACLALDWMRGRLHASWWWRSLFPANDWPAVLQNTWTTHAQHAPEALQRLEQQKRCSEFLQSAPHEFVEAITIQIASLFDIQQPAALIIQATATAAEQNPAVKTQTASFRAAPSSPKPQLPWADLVEPSPVLDAPRETLRILSLLLQRAPAILRSTRFLKITQTYVASLDLIGGPIQIHSTTESAPEILNQPQSSIAESPPFVHATPDSETPATALIDSTLEPTNIEVDESVLAQSILLPESKPRSLPSQLVWNTQFGGIFYLINVALALEIYNDFTRPKSVSLPMPIWDWLALMGSKILDEEFESDPAWKALAVLAARDPDEPPGAHFDPPNKDEWLTQQASQLQTRLASAMGETDLGALQKIIFHHCSRITADCETVTVRFSLAEHPISLRIAGLDRDPGWIPAAGRVVRFEYD